MIKKIAKKFLVTILVIMPLDRILRFSQSITHAIAGLIFFRDWRLQPYGRPQFYKHQMNFSRWMLEPSRWSFTARGVYAREHMFKDCSVLDLCCGDGSDSYLFFSDIAGKIDAVDNNQHALTYARKFFSAPTIKYYKLNIVEENFPSVDNEYDVVVWNAAICYFSSSEIEPIFNKIIKSGKKEMVLCGMLPKGFGYPDHKFEFDSKGSLEEYFHRYFKTVTVKEVAEISPGGLQPIISFYFTASNPVTVLRQEA